MALRAWRVWGVSAILAGGVVALAQSPKSDVSGRATPPITQDHFQPESAPTPRVLPQQVRESNPSKTAPPTASEFTGNVIGLQAPGVPTPDLDLPTRVVSACRSVAPAETGGLAEDWKGRVALGIAEMHCDACELDEARQWYLEVLTLAPGTKAATIAEARLNKTVVTPAGGETREPPLADLRSSNPAIPIP